MECFLEPGLVDTYIQGLHPSKLNEIGSLSWLRKHEMLQKLNQEAVIEAAALKHEYVKEMLVTCEKSAILVHEAIVVNTWKSKILPLLLKFDPNPKTTFVAYAILYHEAVSVGLLELIMFHPDGCSSLFDAAGDLLEYAYDAATMLIALKYKIKESKDELQEGNFILNQRDDLAFNIGIRCLSIIRYMAENLDRVSLDVATKIYEELDVSTLLIQLLLEKPWLKGDKIYRQGEWVQHNSEAVSQAEAQVWLALRQIFLAPECMTRYEITNGRRSQMQKLLPMLSPTILDQISPLVELKHWLCQVAASNEPPATPKSSLLKTISTIKEAILKQGSNKWKSIAKAQIKDIFCTDKNQTLEVAQILSSAFNTDLLEKFENRNTKLCKVCEKEARQRCSRCKTEWYCSRNCQATDWKNHKETCTSP